MLTVQVWDKTAVSSVEKAIRASGLGLNPAADGQLVRVPIPELTEERRLEMAKIAHKYAEQARVAVRNVRRDGMENLKKMEKDGDLNEDDHHLWSEEVQQLTDQTITKIDEALATKDEEIKQV
jgi:ribosome recycling factor